MKKDVNGHAAITPRTDEHTKIIQDNCLVRPETGVSGRFFVH